MSFFCGMIQDDIEGKGCYQPIEVGKEAAPNEDYGNVENEGQI